MVKAYIWYSILGVEYDLILVLGTQFFEYLRETLYKHVLEHLEAVRPEKIMAHFFSSYGKCLTIIDIFEACDWSGHILGASASPRSLTKNRLCHPLPVQGCQHDTKYVALELLLHATFVADQIWGFMLEPARSALVCSGRRCSGQLISKQKITRIREKVSTTLAGGRQDVATVFVRNIYLAGYIHSADRG